MATEFHKMTQKIKTCTLIKTSAHYEHVTPGLQGSQGMSNPGGATQEWDRSDTCEEGGYKQCNISPGKHLP